MGNPRAYACPGISRHNVKYEVVYLLHPVAVSMAFNDFEFIFVDQTSLLKRSAGYFAIGLYITLAWYQSSIIHLDYKIYFDELLKAQQILVIYLKPTHKDNIYAFYCPTYKEYALGILY